MSENIGSNHNQDWRKALLNIGATLQQAISCLNESAAQIVLLVNPDGTLRGTLTDGDIRRGLLRGLDLNCPVDSLINPKPLVVPTQLGREAVLQLMQANDIYQIPVLDDRGCVVGLHQLDTLITPPMRENVMVVMVGGQGVRLRPHTENCPKPLLPVGDKPMLQHIIERAKSQGFRRFVLAVNYLGYMIEEYFGDGSRWNVQIEYLREDFPMGTAGAIALLSPRPSLPFLVSNGDVLTDIRYGELIDFHRLHSAAATMVVRVHEWQHPFGVVHIRGVDIVGFEEKPVNRTHINAGVYALEPFALNLIRTDEPCDMPTLFERLQIAGARTVVYPMHEPWLDVGRYDDLRIADQAFGTNTQR